MHAENLSEADESFLDELFDLSVRGQATGTPPDLDVVLQARPHLREHVLRVASLAKNVALAEAPPNSSHHLPVVGGFTILEEVGRGGVGIVYRARQQRLDRIVALKLLAPSLMASQRSRERFSVEAKALGRIRHPHVVTIHEVLADGGLCGYAMEWVDGSTLAKAVGQRDPRLDFATIARLGVNIARALEAVHAAGMIHRDVKPGNILLRRDGTPLLSDFSLVRDAGNGLHTATGDFVGTAAYAAPEQLRGNHDEIGAWTDVYGLGVSLYSVLAGQTPFGTSSTVELLRRIESGLAAPMARFNPRVPGDLATIIGKAMDPEPGRRYRTAGELADDLERFLRFEPIRARRIGLSARFVRLARRNRAAFTAATIASLLILSLSVAVGVSWKRRLELPARFREELRQARSLLLDPDVNHRFFIALNMGVEAPDLPLPPVAVIDRSLEGYRRAMALMPDDESAALEHAVVTVVRGVLARERELPPGAERLRTRCPTTFDVAEEWLSAGRPKDVAVARLGALNVVDRRSLGLLAYLCTCVPLCVSAWEALEADPSGDDPFIAGALGEAWLVMDRPALAVPRLQRARQEFPECGFLTLDLSDALVRTGDLARAEAMLAVAKELPNHASEPTRVEADLCAARGQKDRARALYYRIGPRPPTASFHLAQLLAGEGDRSSAFDCLGAICVTMPSVPRYRAFLLDLLDPVFSRLGLDQQVEAVAEAAHGSHQHVPVYAIGRVLRDRGWLHDPPDRDPHGHVDGIGLRDMLVTPEVMTLVSGLTWRSRPRDVRALVRISLLADSAFRQSSMGRTLGLAVSLVVRARARSAGLGLPWKVDPGPWEQRGLPASLAVEGAGGDLEIPNVVGAGDVDGDGRTDVLVGYPGALDGRGMARLCSGRSLEVLRTFTGDANSHLGRSLAAAGDVDRDGRVDFLIGASGHVLVCSGQDGGVIRTLRGRSPEDAFGSALAAAGDVDRDGFPDALVGAPDGSYAQVISGRNGAVLHTYQGQPGFGASVDGGQDADGDAVPDVLIGSPWEESAGLMKNGRVSLFSGATGALLWTEAGPTSFLGLGTSVAFLGDVDGDGMADCAAGAPETCCPWVTMGAGHVRIYAGLRGTLLRAIGGFGAVTGGFGRGLFPAGDLDRDGIQDLLVAADPLGYFEILSGGRDFSLIRHVAIPMRAPSLGSALCGNVDIDGDGTPDVLIGTADAPGFARIPAGSHAR